ncbi:Oryzain alpha chain [Camellia lanceoleosa]|uniref:Oryzain alpha chain n=1 Tax=Camellia lanceoleosa TaxID=1840588 RepID=A0ACC0I2A7_9ERIC|nr:Oryzain alpha chain [Camellia lanceoleosa]
MSMSTILLILLFASLSYAIDNHIQKSSPRSDDEVMGLYEEWLVKHGKAYNSLGEKDKRFEIFKDNLKFVDEHNSENRTYKVGMNRFADLTNGEYRSRYLGTRTDAKRRLLEEWQCDPTRKNAKVVSIDDYEDVPPFDELALKNAVAHQPVSVAIEASGRALQLYLSGIFTGECGMALDHGVAVVGYGKENGVDYWIVRNSWGASWGESGYIRMERNVVATYTGKCGIAMQASYPIKDTEIPWTYGDAEIGISSS